MSRREEERVEEVGKEGVLQWRGGSGEGRGGGVMDQGIWRIGRKAGGEGACKVWRVG